MHPQQPHHRPPHHQQPYGQPYGPPPPPPPMPRPPRPPRRRRPLRTALIIATALTPAFALAAVLGDRQDQPDDKPPAAPAYDVRNLDDTGPTGRADLLIPDARPPAAEAAIRDYADRIDRGDLDAYTLDVIRTEDAATVVCRGEWRADDRAAQLYGGTPGLTVECPDPKPLD